MNSDLDKVFRPERIAVIGASDREESVGGTVMRNLSDAGYEGDVYAVNPKHDTVRGSRAYDHVGDLPETPDLAVICTPAETVPQLVNECGEVGIEAAIIISAGFGESGDEGRELQHQLREAAGRFERLRILGPNCLGVIVPDGKLNASFAADTPAAGSVAFVSQSGALCTSVLDRALQRGIGFSHFVSVGNMLDIGFADLVEYLGRRSEAESTILYIESIGNARDFMSAARRFARHKPIIAYKAGRFSTSAEAAASHTGAMAGEDAVFDAAFRRAGIERIFETDDMFDCAALLTRCCRPRGNRLAIVTNAGGPGVMAADALIAAGGELAKLSPETISRLAEFLPADWSGGNPVDILGDAGPDRFARAVKTLLDDESADALLVVLTPQAMTDATETAREIGGVVENTDKPVLGAWMGGNKVRDGAETLRGFKAPVYDSPESAIKAFAHLASYAGNLEIIDETPGESPGQIELPADRKRRAREILTAGPDVLLEHEAKDLLNCYGIRVAETHLAESADAAVDLAGRTGYPVAMKIASRSLSHKSDVGGVALGLSDEDAVRTAFERIMDSAGEKDGDIDPEGVTVQPMIDTSEGLELIAGVKQDATFGAILMVGTGGVMTEIIQDRVIELPPLNQRLARRMLESLRSWSVLRGYRDRSAVAIDELTDTLIRLSYLAAEQPAIAELDINPLLATPREIVALDAHVRLDASKLDSTQPPFAHLAIPPGEAGAQ